MGRRRRYRCLRCGRTFGRRTGTVLAGLGCSAREFERVALLSIEGLSRSAIARVEHLDWHTVDRWLSKASALAMRFNHAHIQGVPLAELQADELCTTGPSSGRTTWVFTSIEVCSRLWISTVVGRRSYDNTRALLRDTQMRSEIRDIPLITTDGFKFYKPVICKMFGFACVYAQVIKTWLQNRITHVERRAVIGTERRLEQALIESEDSTRINTAYIERLNLTLRQSTAYLHRHAPTHARCEEKLDRQLELARCYYNFARRHHGLRFGCERRTPAMVAGLADRALTFRSMFALP
ncbi:MAG: hypothetical protein KC492_28175 [Myxococcales bacterium]|nr:hypothetical protein [Myxococcales bacterium]